MAKQPAPPASSQNPPSKEPAVVVRNASSSPPKPTSFLSEINGADVKSLLRKRREEITKSLGKSPVPSPQPEAKTVKEVSAQPEVSVGERRYAQPAQNLDLLQRRKLLFIESSSSEITSFFVDNLYSVLSTQGTKTVGNRNYIFVCNSVHTFDKYYIIKINWRTCD